MAAAHYRRSGEEKFRRYYECPISYLRTHAHYSQPVAKFEAALDQALSDTTLSAVDRAHLQLAQCFTQLALKRYAPALVSLATVLKTK